MRLCGMLLCALFVVASVAADDSIAPADRRKFADGLYSRGMYDLAVREYDLLLKKQGQNAASAVLWLRVGECRRELGESALAEQAFSRAAVLADDQTLRDKAVFKRAAMFMEQGHHEVAAELLNELLTRELPEALRTAALFSYGDALLRTGKLTEGITWLEALTRDYPESKYAVYGQLRLGRLYAERKGEGDLAKAKQTLNDVLAKRPGDRLCAEARFLLAHVYYQAKDFKESAREFLALQREFPEDLRTASSRREAAWAFYSAGMYAESERVATEALGVPTVTASDEWLYLRANSRRGSLQHSGAGSDYRLLIERYPKSSFTDSARMELALVAYREGRFRDAITAGELSRVEGAVRADLLWLLAESHAALTEPEQAMQYYRLLLEGFPDSERAADAHYRLAHALQKGESWGEAARQFQSLAERFPKHKLAPQSLLASGVCLSRGGKGEEAVRDWQVLISRYPAYRDVAEARYLLAMECIRLKRTEPALLVLGKLIETHPDSVHLADAYYWRGSLLRERGETKGAEASLKRAVALATEPVLRREAGFLLGIALQEQGKDAAAADLFRGVLDADGAGRFSPERLAWLSEFEYARGEYEQAFKAANALVERDATARWQETAWTLAGRARLASKQRAEARACFEKAAAIGRNSSFAAESALRLGELCLADGDVSEAAKWLDAAAQRASAEGRERLRAEAYIGLGRVAEKRNDDEAALRYFMTVALLFDDDERVPIAMERAVHLLGRLRRVEERQRVITELRERYPASEAALRFDGGAGGQQ